MPDMIRVTPAIEIDEDELVEAFVRASGPGGQNVNKVASAVELRFNVDRCENLTAPVKARLKRLAGRRLNQEGWIVLKADRYRSQERNRDDARQRLVAMIAEAAVAPRPRIKTRPSLGAKKRRLEAKSRRGNVKKLRSSKPTFD
jgi:ribosome-associated protein